MRVRFFIFISFLAIVIAGYWYVKTPAGTDTQLSVPAETGVSVGKVLVPFALANLEGEKVQVGSSGKVTVINFWATWCPPCREEMPELNRFSATHRNTVAFYSVNLQESQGKVKDFMQQNGYTFPVLLDSDGAVGKTFRVAAIPTTLIMDNKGVIVFRKSGTVTMRELEEIIKNL